MSESDFRTFRSKIENNSTALLIFPENVNPYILIIFAMFRSIFQILYYFVICIGKRSQITYIRLLLVMSLAFYNIKLMS